MNIFVLDADPRVAAEYHCDKHCVKMILEYAQILSTAHRVLDGSLKTIFNSSTKRNCTQFVLPDERESVLYKATHINHPSTIWARQSSGNYIWLRDLFFRLSKEYEKRYNRQHATFKKLMEPLSTPPKTVSHANKEFVPSMLAMPDDSKNQNSVIESYRRYYIDHKRNIAKWKSGHIPPWFPETKNDPN